MLLILFTCLLCKAPIPPLCVRGSTHTFCYIYPPMPRSLTPALCASAPCYRIRPSRASAPCTTAPWMAPMACGCPAARRDCPTLGWRPRSPAWLGTAWCWTAAPSTAGAGGRRPCRPPPCGELLPLQRSWPSPRTTTPMRWHSGHRGLASGSRLHPLLHPHPATAATAIPWPVAMDARCVAPPFACPTTTWGSSVPPATTLRLRRRHTACTSKCFHVQ